MKILVREDLELLKGAIDMHVHSAPDLFARSIDHIDLAKQAAEAGMKGIMLKCHFSMTPFRAYLAEKAAGGGIKVFGGIALNHSVGCLNPYAVDVALKAGGKIVWMPTLSAANHIKFYGSANFKAQKTAAGDLLPIKRGISPIKNEKILPEVEEIMNLIADANAIFCTGHCSVKESQILVKEAKRRGVKKIVVTHPEFEVTNMPVDVQKELTSEGAIMERIFIPISPSWRSMDVVTMVKRIKEVGAEHAILSTDLGQRHNPLPTDGYRMFIQILLEGGISYKEIEIMAKKNTAKLLDLD